MKNIWIKAKTIQTKQDIPKHERKFYQQVGEKI